MKRRALLVAAPSLATLALPSAASNAVANPNPGLKEIIFGQTLDLSSSRSAIAQAYSGGAKLVFDAINKVGGIHGRKLRVIQMDDAYQTQQAMANAKTLVEQRLVFSVIHSVGTSIASKLVPYLEQQDVPYIHPLTGADQVRPPAIPSRQTFFLRASYNQELEKIVQHITTLGISNVALVYEDEPFGQGVRAQVLSLMKQHELKLSAVGVLPHNQPDMVKDAVDAVAKPEPTAVIVGSAGPAVGSFIAACKAIGLHSQFYCLSVSNVDGLNKALGKHSQGILVSQVMPSVTQSKMAVVRQYRRAVVEANGVETSFGLEGYISGRLIERALQSCGQSLTRENFVAAMANPSSTDVGGFPTGLQGRIRTGSPFVELAMIRSNGRLLQ